MEMWDDSADIYSAGEHELSKTENRIRLGLRNTQKTETKGSINSQIEEGPTGQRAKKKEKKKDKNKIWKNRKYKNEMKQLGRLNTL